MNKIFLFFLIAVIHALSQTVKAQTWTWAYNGVATVGGDHAAHSIAKDATGNVYMAGYFNTPTIAFGSAMLTNAGSSSDVFLVKYSPAGSMVWAMRAGGTSLDRSYSVTTDAFGHVYLAGFFQSTSITFGSFTLTGGGSSDMFLVKMDTAGTVLWARNSGYTTNNMNVTGVAADTFGNVYLTGNFGSSTLRFGATTLANSGSFPYNDAYLVKYDSAGTFKWVVKAGGTVEDYSSSVAADATGYVYMTGRSSSAPINFGAVSLTNAGTDMFLCKYDSLGTAIWARNTGAIGVTAQCVAADPSSGSLCVSGYFSAGTVTFGTTTLTNTGSNDMYVAKYNSAGALLWAKSGQGNDWESGAGVCFDAMGNVYATGFFFSDTLTFDTTDLINTASANIYLVKFDSAGAILYAVAADSGGGGGIAVTADTANVYIAGTVSGGFMRLGMHDLTAFSSSSCSMIAKYHRPSACTNIPVASFTQTGLASRTFTYTGTTIALDSVVWDLGDGTTATGLTTTHSYPVGTYTVCVRSYTSCGADTSCQIFTISAVGVGALSVNDVKVYPNPANDILNVINAGCGVLTIDNMMGQRVYSGDDCLEKRVLDISSIASGIYIIRLDGAVLKKLIKN